MDFFLIKTGLLDPAGVEEKYHKSFEVFEKRQQKKSKVITNNKFHLSIYDGLNTNCFIKEFSNGDFIISIGTLIYKDKYGNEALEFLFEDIRLEKRNLYNDLIGSFAVLIFYNGELHVFNDFLGLKRVYKSTDNLIFSSSFLAAAQAISSATPNKQVVYEYLLRGGMYGDETLVKEINLIPRSVLYNICNYRKNIFLKFDFERLPFYNDFDKMVDYVSDQYLEMFKTITDIFGSKLTTALSGGYDSRFMLALIRKNNVIPSLYVYGKSNSSDVIVAKHIAKEEGLNIQHIDKDTISRPGGLKYEEIIENNFFMFDGISNSGIFDDGTDIFTRKLRSMGGLLQLNGAGGEIWRNFWGLNRFAKKPIEFVRHKWDIFDYSPYSPGFNKERYFDNFTNKLLKSIDLPSNEKFISRRDMEISYPLFRYRYFQSMGHSTNLLMSNSMMPLMETKFLYPSFDLPIQFKYYGKFEACLIRKVDQNLASYNSNYGHDFLGKLPMNKILKDTIKRNLSLTIKPYLRSKISTRKEFIMPKCLQEPEVTKVLNLKNMFISDYVKTSLLKNPISLSRALTVEYFFDRIR